MSLTGDTLHLKLTYKELSIFYTPILENYREVCFDNEYRGREKKERK